MRGTFPDPGPGGNPVSSSVRYPPTAPVLDAHEPTSGHPVETDTLPRGWCLVAAPGSEASAVFLPGGDVAGTIVVRCAKVSRGCPSMLRAMGRIPVNGLPGECDLEMDWEILYQGPEELTGKEAFLSVTQGSMTMRPNLDPHTAYSLPREPGEPRPSGEWRLYSSVTKIRDTPFLDHMLIGFNLLAPGRYTFKPPMLQVVLPSGLRFPYAVE